LKLPVAICNRKKLFQVFQGIIGAKNCVLAKTKDHKTLVRLKMAAKNEECTHKFIQTTSIIS